MIRILGQDESPVRLFASTEAGEIHFFERYGFVSAAALASRRRMRLASGAHAPGESELFRLNVRRSSTGLHIETRGGVQAVPINGVRWQIRSLDSIYFIEAGGESAAVDIPALQAPSGWKTAARNCAVLLFLLLLIMGVMMIPKGAELMKAQDQELNAPVILHEQVPPPPVQKPRATAVDPQAKARKALTQQLGFLGLVGKKDLKKAMGGLPTEAEHVSPGAGPGGDAGSGGELLAGMGRGLHKTTVGNSGVSGLGGLGTKGAGGGAGGYGDTSYGGAGGQTLSAIPLAQDAKIDDGLDRSQIQATIMRYLSQVRACYEEGLKRNQNLIGQVTMNFEVSGTGGVNFARVARSSINDRPVENCISSKMLYWKFPQPRNGKSVGVSYPFMLRPVKS